MSSSSQTLVSSLLTDVTEAADIAAATGNPIAGVVATGIAVAGSVASQLATHQSALATAVSAADALTKASAPVIARLPAVDQQKATGMLAAISSLLAGFASFF